MLKLLGTTKNETAKDENGKNMSPLEITKKNRYQDRQIYPMNTNFRVPWVNSDRNKGLEINTCVCRLSQAYHQNIGNI